MARPVKEMAGCLILPFALPCYCLATPILRTLGRFRDLADFRSRSPDGLQFDRIGRWHSKNPGNTWGIFGVSKVSNSTELRVTIYYSRFQRYRSGQLEKRIFRRANEWNDIPVATKRGNDDYFSWIPEGQLVWLSGYDGDSTDWKWFDSLRPMSFGKWREIAPKG
ncbi:MAG: hypothetical protein R3F19_15365 [Verrucomicrobiales bacterium]